MRALTLPAALVLVALAGAAACEKMPMAANARPDAHFTDARSAQLAEAVAQGNAYAIVTQIKQGADPDARDDQGLTLLQYAILARNKDGLEALLDSGANPNLPGYEGSTALHTAAIDDDPAYLRLLLAHGGDPNVAHAVTGERPLAKAVGPRTAAQFQMLLEAGADPNLADRTGNTPLHRAAMVNAGGSVLALLEAGANPQAKNAQDATFQPYYFGVPDKVLSQDARKDRKAVLAWLRAHDVPIEVGSNP